MLKVNTDPKIIDELVTRGVEEVIVREHLKERLLSGEILRVKFGVDPTAPDLHLGHAVPLRKLRQFQEAGHKAVLIIGDFTATIGDPSGRTETRQRLTKKEVKNNLKKYLKQAGKILNLRETEVQYNSKWFKGTAAKLFEIVGTGTLQQVLHRADFKKRIENNQDITLPEILYPVFQGYDSVMVKADLEIGGTDQKFNLLMGRQVQRHYGQSEQDILTVPIIEGLDGVRKMSKSYNNYVALDEKPEDMFGKIMSLPDNLIIKYFKLCTAIPLDEIEKIEADMKADKVNPKDIKIQLGYELVKIYHNGKKALEAKENFIKTFQKKEVPDNILEIEVSEGEELSEVLLKNNFVKSKSDFKRLTNEGAITRLEKNESVNDYHFKLTESETLKIGKKRFIRIVIK